METLYLTGEDDDAYSCFSEYNTVYDTQVIDQLVSQLMELAHIKPVMMVTSTLASIR